MHNAIVHLIPATVCGAIMRKKITAVDKEKTSVWEGDAKTSQLKKATGITLHLSVDALLYSVS